ncbi:hypothetical protein EDC90_10061 [Martelella mediterranea]|uniref:Uncharacterized protein n=1 Tax=Martelella mediterranea TaxID=293089 RepID=A0A4V2V4P8_9HYPH|nr:hypothetical protein EDC90_10061 [Martelella mediterranea]
MRITDGVDGRFRDEEMLTRFRQLALLIDVFN